MKAEEAIREFAEKWGFSQDKTDEGFLIDNDRTKQCLSDLTALISEHYYPKEFIVWKEARCRTSNREGKYLYWEDHFTLDELYEYWKENER